MPEEDELMIDGRPISEMKVVELKEELGRRGLSKIGNKNALHERLKEFLLSESNAKDESVKQLAAESPEKELASPPNPLVAEYLAKQQTALREARKDAEAVRRASSGDDASPVRDKSVTVLHCSQRCREISALEDAKADCEKELMITSGTEQNVREVDVHDAEKGDVYDSTPEVLKKEINTSSDSTFEITETELAKTEQAGINHDETGAGEVQHPANSNDHTSCLTDAKSIIKEHDMQQAEESRVDDEVGSDLGGSGIDDDGSGRSRSRSVVANDVPFEQITADLEEISNQGMVKTTDNASFEKTKVMERADGTRAVMEIEDRSSSLTEKKRRWKPSATTQAENNVVTVSFVKQKQEEIKSHEKNNGSDTETSAAFDFKEDLPDSKDKMEELDYEEPVQSSVAEIAEEMKAVEESTDKHKTKTFERLERHGKRPEHSHVRKRSLTPNKHRESRTTVDGFVRERSVSPARYPVNQVIMIRQLTRPYTVKQLQELLSIFGTIVEGGFWIDNIKSTCLAKYSTVEEAVVARGRLHNIVWPPCSPRTLKIDYSDDANLDKHLANDQRQSEVIPRKDAEMKKDCENFKKSPPTLRVSLSIDEKRRHVQPASQGKSGKDLDKVERERHGHERRGRKRSASPIVHSDTKRIREQKSPWRRPPLSPESRLKEPEKRVKTADELFLKTKTQPAIYYLPLTEEQILERAKRKAVEAEMAKKIAQNGNSSKRKEKDDQAKDKTSASKRLSVKSSPSRRRSRTPPFRRRSRSPVMAQRDRRRSKSRSPRHRR